MKVVLFGAGYWGRNYIRELGSHLVGVVEPHKGTALKVSDEFGVKVFSYLPRDLKFDGAIIATPPMSHIKIAAPLLDEGKYVLIEKPLAHSLDELRELDDTRRCMSSLVYLYHPEVEGLKQLFLEGRIGVHAFSIRTNDGPARVWSNALWDLAPHDISIFNYVIGKSPTRVNALYDRSWAFLDLEYDDVPLSAYVYVSWVGGPKTRRMEFLDLKGSDRIVFDDVARSAALVVSPLRSMLNDFLSGEWSLEKASFEVGYEVVSILERASV